MKRIYPLLSIALLILFFIIPEKGLSQRWIQSFNDYNGKSAFHDIKVIDEYIYGIINAGIANYDGATELHLVKFDQQGNQIWSKLMFNGTGLCLEFDEGHIYIGGCFKENYSLQSKMIKCNYDGDVIWEKSFGAGFISVINPTIDGIFVGGNFDETGARSKAYLAFINHNSNLLWERKYQFSSNSSIVSIYKENDELIMIADVSTVGVGFEGIYIFAIQQSDGQMIWQNKEHLGYFDDFLGYEKPNIFNSKRDSDHNIVIVYPVNEDGKSVILKYSSSGELLSKNYNFHLDHGSYPHHLEIFENEDYIIAGSYRENRDEYYCFVERRHPDGDLVWQKKFDFGSLFSLEIIGDTLFFAGTNSNIYSQNSTAKPLLGKMTVDGKLYNNKFNLVVNTDLKGDCLNNGDVEPAGNLPVLINGNLYFTDEIGLINIDLPVGTYNVQCILNEFLEECNVQNTFNFNEDGETVNLYYLLKYKDCQDLSVGINQGELIRCEINTIFVECSNNTNKTILNPLVKLTYDKDLNIVSASHGFESFGEQLIFNFDSINGKESKQIEIEFEVPCDMDLYSVKCFEATVFPKISCKDELMIYSGPDLELVSRCENGELKIVVNNIGSDMTESSNYSIFNNAFEFEKGNLLLKQNESVTFQFAPGGNTISFVVDECKENPINAKEMISGEGCGSQPNGNYSKGFTRMFSGANSNQWRSGSCMEIRDHYSYDRLFEIPLGLGAKNLITKEVQSFEFSLMFKNETDEPITDFTIEIIPDGYFETTSFREIMSSHHLPDPEIQTKAIFLAGGNEIIEPGGQFFYRFKINKKTVEWFSIPLGIKATLISKQKKFDLKKGLYYLQDSIQTDTISPFSIIDKGFLFGRGCSSDFACDIAISDDGSNYFLYLTNEPGGLIEYVICKSDKYHKVQWEKSFKINEGYFYFRKLLVGKNGELHLIGFIDLDKPQNYGGSEALPFILTVDKDGKEMWRNIYPAFDNAFKSSAFHSGIRLNDGNLLLYASSNAYEKYKNFVVTISLSGQILKYENLLFDSFYETISPLHILQGKAGEYYLYLVNSERNLEIIKTDQTEFKQLAYAFYDTNYEGIYLLNLDYNKEKDQIVIACDGYRYEESEEGYDILPFGRIIRFDTDLNFIAENEFFQDKYIFDFNDLKAKGDDIYILGSWYPSDTVSNRDAMWIKVDSTGTIKRFESKNFGANDYLEEFRFNNQGKIYATVQTQAQDQLGDLQAGYCFDFDQSLVNTKEEIVMDITQSSFVFPNPTKDFFRVKDFQHVKKVRLVDMDGHTTDLELNNSGYHVNYLKSGVYLVLVTDANNVVHFGKLVKVD